MLAVYLAAYWATPTVVILFRAPQVFAYITMITTPVLVLCVNNHFFATVATTKFA
jgi:hypothetical protein